MPRHLDFAEGVKVAACLTVNDAARAIDFYTRAFGAVEVGREVAQNGQIREAEVALGGCSLFIADDFPNDGLQCPQRLGGSSVTLRLYVADVAEAVARAQQCGAVMLNPKRQSTKGTGFSATVLDPFGHVWVLLTHSEVKHCWRGGVSSHFRSLKEAP